MAGRQERHPACKKSCSNNSQKSPLSKLTRSNQLKQRLKVSVIAATAAQELTINISHQPIILTMNE